MKIKKFFPLILQFIKFGIVGGINTIISLMIYYILIYVSVHYMYANVIGYFISSVGGYYLNKMWVFKTQQVKARSSITKYYIIYGSSLLINIVTMYVWVDLLNIPKILAPILTLIITIPYNFILNKLWAFKVKEL
ncbi:GtrA family protein [Paenibacillus sp. NPDC057934]|uniref:GtrA family protein n=1 Tax=Paenibacillus sp. NPDC057934 TaxID=3346282 RepID=UPI0036DDD7A3